MIYSQKFLNLIQLEYPNKYQITKTVRRSTSDPSTFISPKLLKGEYDHAWPFSEGLAAVEVDGKIGFINVDGDIVINPQFESPFKRRKDFLGYFYDIYSTSNLYKPYFRDGVCPVYDKLGNLIWIDKSGKITKEPD
jgi:hypothetical protein